MGTAVCSAMLVLPALADNPISSYHYLADPSAAADDSTFYILTDVDDYNNQTNWNYDIIGLYAFSSNDMKNWTDHGMIFRSKREFGNYPGNTWASGIAVHNGRIFIVYPDGASGVGMITAPAIDGPYTDPIMETHGKNRIAGGGSFLGDCDGIAHCFDPGILFDDDGTGYVIFGGGESGQRPYGNNFDIIKFTEDNGKVTLDRSSLTKVQLPNSFEAPYLHKKGDTYYLSFNNRSQVIDYGMSKNIMGPYNYVGSVIPGIGSVPDAHGEGGNNHQGFAEFQGKWYAVYHDRRLVTSDNHPAATTQAGVRSENPNYENHRSVSIDELTWSGDKMNTLKFTREGPTQIRNFDPYKTYKATTSSKQMNIRSRTDWTKGQPVKHVLLPLSSKESWIRISGVDFGKGAENLRIKAANVGDGNKVEIHTGSASGTLAGTCELAKTSNNTTFTDNDCALTGLSGVVEQLFFVFKGSKDSTMGLLEWEFQGTKREPEPQKAFGGKAATVPGKIEVENYDEPGYGAGNDSYADNDAGNQGDADVRITEPVDLVAGGTGVAVGYTAAGEWMEFSIEATEDGEFPITAYASSGAENSSFAFQLDGEPFGDTVKVTKTGEDWSVYQEFSAGKGTITKGPHIVRLTITGDNVNVDWFSIGDAEKPTSLDKYKVNFKVVSAEIYQVFNINGKMVGSVDLAGRSASQALQLAGFNKGVYVLKRLHGNNVIRVSFTK